MNKKTSTRRSFLKGGALLAAPLAVGTAPAILADNGLKARVARLEDEAAIRELHQNWLRRVNTSAEDVSDFADRKRAPSGPQVRGIAADHAGKPDAIEIAPSGKSAEGRFHCVVEFATAIGRNSTLEQMAHAQGGGFIRNTDRRVLNVKYVKANGAWSIAEVKVASA